MHLVNQLPFFGLSSFFFFFFFLITISSSESVSPSDSTGSWSPTVEGAVMVVIALYGSVLVLGEVRGDGKKDLRGERERGERGAGGSSLTLGLRAHNLVNLRAERNWKKGRYVLDLDVVDDVAQICFDYTERSSILLHNTLGNL
ncbi:hypothetical protein DL93DRAFT_1505326 [Clavulina sp. PMI_390]|nr:hypothetical protein DL93DRAFT_1505326 [Clavulina sp. PMI_390]